MVVKYRAYSLTNRDATYVRSEGRLRGCKIGDPHLVFGRTIVESEDNLLVLKHALVDAGAKLLVDKRGSFEVDIDE